HRADGALRRDIRVPVPVARLRHRHGVDDCLRGTPVRRLVAQMRRGRSGHGHFLLPVVRPRARCGLACRPAGRPDMSAILDHLSIGFGVAFSLTNLLVAAIGSFIGTMVGVLPGLGPINGVAMLIPIAFAMNLPPETALILLAAVYVGAEYGGRITSVVLNVPGEASAIMTTLDGYPLARQGLANVALSLSAASAFAGSIVSVTGIILLAPLLAKWALAFGPAEYFVLMVFAFCCLTSLLGKQPVKGVLAAMIGLGISVIGVDSNSGVYRYTFDSVHLADGIDFVVVVIALFAVAEMLEMLEKVVAGHSVEVKPSGRKLFNLKELAFTWWSIVRSSLVGFGVGGLPGAGASVAAATASAIGSFVPMLTLGVPGSGTTAVMMGALTLYNITPGPVLFDTKPELVWGLIASLFIANVLLFVMNVPMVRVFSKVLSVPGWLMVPGILSISYIGVYAINAGTFDLLMVVGIGTIGYFLRKFGVPMAPLVLGVVLGNMMEQNLRRALSITNGDISVLFESSVSIGLWVAAAAVVIVPQSLRKLREGRQARKAVA